MSKGFEELFAKSLETLDMKIGSILSGEVVAIDGDFVLIDAGLKSESYL